MLVVGIRRASCQRSSGFAGDFAAGDFGLTWAMLSLLVSAALRTVRRTARRRVASIGVNCTDGNRFPSRFAGPAAVGLGPHGHPIVGPAERVGAGAVATRRCRRGAG